jgi:hypothetical protein
MDQYLWQDEISKSTATFFSSCIFNGIRSSELSGQFFFALWRKKGSQWQKLWANWTGNMQISQIFHTKNLSQSCDSHCKPQLSPEKQKANNLQK